MRNAILLRKRIMMSDQDKRDSMPNGSKGSRGLAAYVTLVFLISPLAILAIGVGAFLGQWVAVIGWGLAALGLGTNLGAGIGLVLLIAWVFVFVIRAKSPKMDPLSYAAKIACFIEDMKGRGVSPNSAAPYQFQMAVRLGFQIPPPLFMSFWRNFLWTGGLGMALGTSAAALVWWSKPNADAVGIAFVDLVVLLTMAGLGTLGAAQYPNQARRFHLPSWDCYPLLPSGAASGSQEKATSA